MTKRSVSIKEPESKPVLDYLIEGGHLSADVKAGIATLATKKDKVKKSSYWLLAACGLVLAVCAISAIITSHYVEAVNWQAVDLSTIHIPESVTEQLSEHESAKSGSDSLVSGGHFNSFESNIEGVSSVIGGVAKFALLPLVMIVLLVGGYQFVFSNNEDALGGIIKLAIMGVIPIGALMMASTILSPDHGDHIEVKPPEVIFLFQNMKGADRLEKALAEATAKLQGGGVSSQEIDYITAQMLIQLAKRNDPEIDWRAGLNDRLKRLGQASYFDRDATKRLYAIDHTATGKATTPITQDYENANQSKIHFYQAISNFAKIIAIPLLLLGGLSVFFAKNLSTRLWRIRSTIERMRTIQIKTESE
jgi:hypothetical protein